MFTRAPADRIVSPVYRCPWLVTGVARWHSSGPSSVNRSVIQSSPYTSLDRTVSSSILLNGKCLACHGEDPDELEGEFDLRSRAAMLRGGESYSDEVVVPVRSYPLLILVLGDVRSRPRPEGMVRP